MLFSELNIGCFLRTRFGLERRFGMEPKHASENIIRETSDGLVIILHRTIKIIPGHFDPVFCPFELGLEVPEVLCCF